MKDFKKQNANIDPDYDHDSFLREKDLLMGEYWLEDDYVVAALEKTGSASRRGRRGGKRR